MSELFVNKFFSPDERDNDEVFLAMDAEDKIKKGMSKEQAAKEYERDLNIRDTMRALRTVQGASLLDENRKVVNNVAEQAPIQESTKREIKRDLRNPSKPVESVVADVSMGETQVNQQQGKPENKIKNSFMESLAYVLPSVLASGAGALVGGSTGAVAGYQEGTKQADKARDFFSGRYDQMVKQQVAQQRAGRQDEMAAERLKVAQDNLKARQDEIRMQRERTSNLEEDRKLRADERDLGRLDKAKEAFIKRNDVKKFRDVMDDLNDLENLVVYGKKIPDATLAKVARSISGEVGVLNEGDIKRSQINPDFVTSVKRDVKRFLTGEILEEDAKQMTKIVNALRAKKKALFQDKISKFSQSRAKSVRNAAYANDMAADLMNELGIEQTKSPRQRLEELRKRKAGK